MISQALVQEISMLEADFCFALSDPTRILLLYALDEQPLNVTELCNEVNIPQSTASRHLKILRDRGLVEFTRQGSSITYSLSDQRVIQALNLLRGILHDRIAHRANLMAGIEPNP
jgi:DNA-binding transcriptional ArsR family regulator